MSSKQQAYQFLESVRMQLNRELPAPAEMRQRVKKIVNDANSDPSKRHLNNPEHAFLNELATPILFQLLCEYPEMTQEKAKKAFLSESFRNLSAYCSGSPSRRLRHPFNKVLGTKAATIYQRWRRELKKGNPLLRVAQISPFVPRSRTELFLRPSTSHEVAVLRQRVKL